MGNTMSAPISVRLDQEVRDILEAEARHKNVGLSTLLRQIATEAAKEARRRRIRKQTEAVGKYAAANPDAAEFFEDWGTPTAEGV